MNVVYLFENIRCLCARRMDLDICFFFSLSLDIKRMNRNKTGEIITYTEYRQASANVAIGALLLMKTKNNLFYSPLPKKI